MWPFSEIARLRHELAIESNRADLNLSRHGALARDYADARGAYGVTLAKLELANRTVERLELDLEGARSDHRRLVTQLVSLAHGRASGALNLTVDPFAEDEKQADVWLQPEDEDVDTDELVKELGTPLGP